MFLKSLTIDRVRAFDHLELDFGPRRRTVFGGDNATGKSTVLQCIGLVLAGSESLEGLLGSPDDWIRVGHDSATIAATLQTKDGKERELSLVLTRGQDAAATVAANAESLSRLDGALAYTPRSYLTFGYGHARRGSSARSGAFRSGDERDGQLRARSVATLFDGDAGLYSIEAWAEELHAEGGDALAQMMEALNALLPGIDYDHRSESGDLIFTTPDGPLPLRCLNGGFKTMAAWCGDLLYRLSRVFGDYDRPLEARAVLLLDELELHLHPRWQRELVEFLDERLPNVQIVGTTNSPLLAQQLGEDELYFLERDTPGDPPRLRAHRGDPRKLLAHQMLLDPAWGVGTMDSRRVERLRDEYRTLSALPSPDSTDAARLEAVTAELEDLPNWGTETEVERENRELMRQIRDALAAS